ncbi:thioesterase II family protein [Streptomyces sp. AA4]|uniref:thioesterase II family protein n=1 Tax=Streptomyces sp. AA4 TaxID=591158 RepID=UPI00256FB4C1|nr:thioesterase domain-containing protein [Streptomyces sp. AA4]
MNEFHLQDDDGLLSEIERPRRHRPEGPARSRNCENWFLPALRADYTAIETYRPSPGPISAPIHAHTGDADPHAPVADVQAWSAHTNGDFTLTTYPGGHFYLADHAAALTDALLKLTTSGF